MPQGGNTISEVERVWYGLETSGEFLMPSSVTLSLYVRSNNALKSNGFLSK